MDLKRLTWTNPDWDFVTETFDLVWANPSKTLSERGCMVPPFLKNIKKLAAGPRAETLRFFCKTKEGPTTCQLQCFVHVGRWRWWRAAWRRQGISKAHPQAPYRQGEAQHESSAQGSHFLENGLLISWKPWMSNGRAQGCFFSWKVGPGINHPEHILLLP